MANKELTTDENILKSIGELDDDTTNDQVDDGGDDNEESESDSTARGDKGATKEGTTTGKQSQETPGKGDGGKQKGKQTPGPQDIVDRNGNVIAKGGPERRFYEQAQGYKRQAEAAARELATLKPRIEAYEAANNVGKTYGLTPQEIVTSAQLLKAYKESPKETIKYLLTQAQASGIDTNDIIAGGGVSLAAIKQMFEEQFKPIAQERQEKEQRTQVQQQATEQYNTFMSSYPDAVIHNDVLAQLLERDVNLSPEAAYWKLQAFYAKNGLDFSKPLAWHQEQIARGQGKGNTQRRSLPNGMNVGEDVQDSDEVVRADTSLDDIIKSSMRDAGMKV